MGQMSGVLGSSSASDLPCFIVVGFEGMAVEAKVLRDKDVLTL